MPEKEGTAEEKPVENLAVIYHCLEWLPETKANFGALLFDCIVNGEDFLLHVDVVVVELANPAEILDTLLAPAPGEEPTRRLLEEKGTEKETTGGNELDSDYR